MNILFFIHDMSRGSGTERVLSTIANELSNRGYNINIVSCQNGVNSTFELNNSITLHTLHGEKTNNTIIRRIKSIRQLRKLCKENKYDVIICVDVSLVLYVPFINITKAKVISWEHFNYHYMSGSKLQSIARKISARFSDALVVLTKDDYQNYVANEKFINNIVHIYNPIDVEKKLLKNERQKVVLAVGRLEEEKGFDMLLKSWKVVERSFPEWSLKIVGEGQERKKLETLITKLDLLNVSLSGYSENIEEEYSKASILVCSSRKEGFGMILIEAQVNNLPVISFDCPVGPREIIQSGENGILVDNGDINKLAEAIIKMINEPDLRNNLVINAKETVKKFDIQIIADQWEVLLSKLMIK